MPPQPPRYLSGLDSGPITCGKGRYESGHGTSSRVCLEEAWFAARLQLNSPARSRLATGMIVVVAVRYTGTVVVADLPCSHLPAAVVFRVYSSRRSSLAPQQLHTVSCISHCCHQLVHQLQ